MQKHWQTLPLSIGGWILAAGAGIFLLIAYGSTPGDAGTAFSDWPTDSRIVRDVNRSNLVVAVHPHCPCSRATIDALAQAMARCQGLVTAHVLFCRPIEFPEGWEKTELWQSAAAIAGVTPISDGDGVEAQLFGAETSGHVVLYSSAGHLLFSGGITASRGHQGSNPGLDSLISCLTQNTSSPERWPVFGCPLRNPSGAKR
jgi:hypothetical protein